jgi:hypothetical protein
VENWELAILRQGNANVVALGFIGATILASVTTLWLANRFIKGGKR